MSTEQTEQTWSFGILDGMPPGPWIGEPDKIQWVDEATDLDCLIKRNRSGALCGYVGVPPAHPLHGEDYSTAGEIVADVHGGLTYASDCQEDAGDNAICHVPLPGREANVWWFGFDCAHYMDVVPGIDVLDQGTYKTVDYVKAEVANLARQLADVT